MSQASIPDFTIDQPREVQRGFIRLIDNLLANSDVAYRRNERLQRKMRHDPDIMSPLLQRQMSVALLPWSIAPEDEFDDKQVEIATDLTQCIGKMRRWPEFLRQMLESVWYGPSAANIVYQRGDMIYPERWIPVHPDTLTFDEDGRLGIRVGMEFVGTTSRGEDGRVHMLGETDRSAIVLHTSYPQGPDYAEPYEARYQYAGRGLRDTLWYQWLIKHTVLQLWVTYCERYATGIRVGRYPEGNDEGRDSMNNVLSSLLGDVNALLPDSGDESSNYSIDILEPNGQASEVFANLIEGYLAGQIKETIIGQTATTEATASGLGSTLATRHAETFQRIIQFDAMGLEDTLTHELVGPLVRMNYGELDWTPQFKFSVEDVDSEKYMAGIKAAYEMGVSIPERDVRQQLGIREPNKDEISLTRPADPLMGAYGVQPGLFDDDQSERGEDVRSAVS